jgi:hypothetical protein
MMRILTKLQEVVASNGLHGFNYKPFPLREHRELSHPPISFRFMLLHRGSFLLVIWLVCCQMTAAFSQTTEFDIPYLLRVVSDGTVLELSGSFSWALPQSLEAALAGAPAVRVVRLESPGGQVLPAFQVAMIIRQRGLDTYVGRYCASACTVAFLGGRRRWLGTDARLGFHQAHAPNIPPEQANAILREAYEKLAIPSQFVANVLRTPPADLWYPTQRELQAVHYTTGLPPPAMLSLFRSPLPTLSDSTRLLRSAPDSAVIQFATSLSDLLGQLQEVDPETCWAFVYEGPATSKVVLPRGLLNDFATAQQHLVDTLRTTRDSAPDPAEWNQARADLLAVLREKGGTSIPERLRTGADHASFCPAFRDLLQLVLTLPDPRRAVALRIVLSGP